jgi:predicted lipoprotein
MKRTPCGLSVISVSLFLCLPAAAAIAADLPADVAAFVEERQHCDHFRGEDAYDEARAKEINAALDRYCTGTDARLAKLKAKYSKGPAAVATALGEFEDRIE